MKRLALVLALPLLGVLACGEPPEACEPPLAAGTLVRFDPQLGRLAAPAESWLSFPFPSDHRRHTDGALDFGDFPNPEDTDLVESYVVAAETELDGFSTAGPVHLAFEGALDPGSIPTDPAAFLALDAPIQLIDVTPASPGYGQRRPLRWAYRDEAGQYVPAHGLAVAPAWGFPLRPGTTYALVVTDDVKDAEGRALSTPPLLARLLGGDDRCVPAAQRAEPDEALLTLFAPLRTRLAADGLSPWRVAAATVFTTQSITAPLEEIRAQVHAAPAPALRSDGWQRLGPNGEPYASRRFQWSSTQTADYWVMEGRYPSPNYQEGELPYGATGGGFHRVEGQLTPVRTEELRFVLTIPQGTPPDGGKCWPIVEYAHGTGGDAYGFSRSTAGRLAGRGLAAIAIDQPMHGPRALGRSFDVSIMTFNVANLSASRTTMRQSAVDTFVLTRLVRESLRVPAEKSPTGEEICFDPDRVLFFGHSQGGISGSLAAALESDISSWVISGSGGGISITVMEREDVIDFESLVSMLVGLGPEDEPLTELHPVLTLAQSLIDATDPLNFSPFWIDDPALLGRPQSVLMTSGEDDGATPHRTATAQAVAGRIPLVEPVAIGIPEYGMLGIEPAKAPLAGNAGGATAGFLQWRFADHFVVFDLPEAVNASMRFLQSTAYEAGPVIERDWDADVR